MDLETDAEWRHAAQFKCGLLRLLSMTLNSRSLVDSQWQREHSLLQSSLLVLIFHGESNLVGYSYTEIGCLYIRAWSELFIRPILTHSNNNRDSLHFHKTFFFFAADQATLSACTLPHDNTTVTYLYTNFPRRDTLFSVTALYQAQTLFLS